MVNETLLWLLLKQKLCSAKQNKIQKIIIFGEIN